MKPQGKPNEKASAKTPWSMYQKYYETANKIFKKVKGLKERLDDFPELVFSLYDTSPEFKNILKLFLPNDGEFHNLLEIIYDGKTHVDKILTQRKVWHLVHSLVSLQSDYGRNVMIKWLKFNETFAIAHRFVPLPPIQSRFIIRDRITKMQKNKGKRFETPTVRLKTQNGINLFNVIYIDDKTNFEDSNPLHKLLHRVEEMTNGCPSPTIIKYDLGDGTKQMLLVYLPKLLDLTTFKDNYLKWLSRIHNDFYQIETFKGAPEKQTISEEQREKYVGVYRTKYIERKTWHETAKVVFPDYQSLDAAISIARSWAKKGKELMEKGRKV